MEPLDSRPSSDGIILGMSERELWQSVLRRARWDARGQFLFGEDREVARAEVSEWIWTDDFDEVCIMAGLDPDAARGAMRRELGG